ncbi:hypothetical protein EVAR_52535_1 [Eumeta japonica]|uniref:Uncharacterized protein n=1 Tax=Eumeta variegata TaxID=151549 RepID=A0A4C1ZSA1_EUMVA|nr:hypothetical protein EVAR_52535_1 [Eumeta japonica]
MNECSFSVNYDKTVFILIHVRRAEGSRARNGYGWATHGECGAMRGYGGARAGRASDSSERQHSDSRAVGGARAAAAGAGASGAEEPYSCDTAPNETTATATAIRRFGGLLRLRRYAALRFGRLRLRRGGGGGLLLRGGGGGSRCGRGGGGLLFGVGALDFVVGEPAAAAAFLLPPRRRKRRSRRRRLPPPPALDEAAEDADLEPARFCSPTATPPLPPPPPPPPEDFSNRKMT